MYNWTSMDMALCLELALGKEGDKRQNVLYTLNSLSKKTFRHEDEEMPAALQAIAAMPDPVGVVQQVVDNFFMALCSLNATFREEEPIEPESEMTDDQAQYLADMARMQA